MLKIKKRSDGRYQTKVSLGVDESGRRIQKIIYGKTQKECREKAELLKSEINRGLDQNEIDSTLGKWCDLYLNDQKLSQTASMYNLKSGRINFLRDSLGANTKIRDIKPFQITSLLGELAIKNNKTHRPSSTKTLKEYRSVWSQMFQFAIANGGTTVDPVKQSTTPKGASKTERRALSIEERRWVEEIPDNMQPHKTMAMLGLWAGLRRGEIAALTWKDVDLKNQIIRINKSYDFKEKKDKSPKSEKGYRNIPILPKLDNYLKTLKHNSEWVCGDVRKPYIWRKCLSEIMVAVDNKHGNPKLEKHPFGEKYVVMISIQGFGWHELRHTFATMLYEKGCPVLEAAQILGHDKQMTINIYTHLMEEQSIKTWQELRDKFEE